MTTSREQLEDRLAGASLVIAECDLILRAVGRAKGFADRSGHTSLIGETSAMRRAAMAAKHRATVVHKNLTERVKAEVLAEADALIKESE